MTLRASTLIEHKRGESAHNQEHIDNGGYVGGWVGMLVFLEVLILCDVRPYLWWHGGGMIGG